MAGIYIHIPYCKQKCHYCNFFSVAGKKYREEITGLLCTEIRLQQNYLDGEAVSTIYFGGGTPSILSGEEISRLLEAIGRYHSVESNPEITLEANPDDLTQEKLKEIRQTGVNRLSIGIQSFHDTDLQFLNRVHSAEQAEKCVISARDAGFDNLSIDLIYGIPSMDEKAWEQNLEKAVALSVPHISAYALTVEPKTPLDLLIRKGKVKNVNEMVQLRHFEMLTQRLQEAGFLHYEISNFCKPGMFAGHNTSYWKGVKYLGIGPSAHSFNGSSRQWNQPALGAYVQSLLKESIPYEKEELSLSQRYNEYVMTSLRTMWGCDLGKIRNEFGEEWAGRALREAGKYIIEGFLQQSGQVLTLTEKGKFRADGITADLFSVD